MLCGNCVRHTKHRMRLLQPSAAPAAARHTRTAKNGAANRQSDDRDVHSQSPNTRRHPSIHPSIRRPPLAPMMPSSANDTNDLWLSVVVESVCAHFTTDALAFTSITRPECYASGIVQTWCTHPVQKYFSLSLSLSRRLVLDIQVMGCVGVCVCVCVLCRQAHHRGTLSDFAFSFGIPW